MNNSVLNEFRLKITDNKNNYVSGDIYWNKGSWTTFMAAPDSNGVWKINLGDNVERF